MKKKKSIKSDTIKERIEKNQEEWLEAFKSQWTITGACKRIGINPDTYYEWAKKYPEFKKRKEEIEKEQIDFVEAKLYEAINSGNLGAIIFYLKCRGGERWKERTIQQLEGQIKTKFELTDEQFNQIIRREAKRIDNNQGSEKEID